MDESKEMMTRYLLGELAAQEQSALEEKYFADPEVFNQVLKIENELVDGYARDQLSKELRERFERSYMAHPSRMERVKFAEALVSRLDQGQPSVTLRAPKPVSSWQKLIAALRGQPFALQLSMAAVILLIVLGSLWFFVDRARRQREAALIQAANEERQRHSQQVADEEKRTKEELTAREGTQPTPELSPTPKVSRSVSLALTVGGVRGGSNTQIPTLVLAPGVTQAQLLLTLKESDYPGYRATLRTAAGVEIFRQTNVNPRRTTAGSNFAFTVPAGKLARGDYVLTLSGVSPNGEVEDLTKSLFRVEKK